MLKDLKHPVTLDSTTDDVSKCINRSIPNNLKIEIVAFSLP